MGIGIIEMGNSIPPVIDEYYNLILELHDANPTVLVSNVNTMREKMANEHFGDDLAINLLRKDLLEKLEGTRRVETYESYLPADKHIMKYWPSKFYGDIIWKKRLRHVIYGLRLIPKNNSQGKEMLEYILRKENDPLILRILSVMRQINTSETTPIVVAALKF